MCQMLPKAFLRSSQAKQIVRWFSFASRSASHDSVACSTQPDIFGRNPFWMRPSKYLFEHMYDVAMDARREKKILLSQFGWAIGLKFAGFFKSPFLLTRTMIACRQDLGMLACCQTLQHTVYSRRCSEGHLFQTRYRILFGPGAELF